MAKLGLILLASIALLAGCGGATKTVTVSGPSTGSVPTAITSAAACFKAAGAAIRGPKPAGRGSAVYATTRDGAQIGLVKAPNATVAGRIQFVFSAGGEHTKSLKNDPTAFTIYKGRLNKPDSNLLTKCTQ